MNDGKLLILATVALLLEAGAIAAGGEKSDTSDATSASVAALKKNLGKAPGLEIDEVRVTDAGVACIEYRMNNKQGGKNLGHAVVQGDKVLKSSVRYARFEKAWNEHCLGPRGGMSGNK